MLMSIYVPRRRIAISAAIINKPFGTKITAWFEASPMLSVGSDSGQLHNNWWLRHDTGSPRLAAEHLLCTVPWSGTPCLTTSAHSRTMFLLNRAWKPGCSLGTSVHSALETFVTMRYINLHLLLPLPLPSDRRRKTRKRKITMVTRETL